MTIYSSYVSKRSKPVFYRLQKIFRYDQPQPPFVYKLQRLQQLLKSMYDECKYCVKTNTDQLFRRYPICQWCRIRKQCASGAGKYVPKRHEIFDDLCTPVKLADMALSSMSLADDLVLLRNQQTTFKGH